MWCTPWRSHAWLALPVLLALGACAPQLGLNDLPPPCITGYGVCPTTGFCVSQQILDEPMRPPQDEAICPSTISVRQGAEVLVPVPGIAPADVSVAGPGNLGMSVTAAAGGAAVRVTAAHGTPPTDMALLTLTTKLGGVASTRVVRLIVSQIGVSSDTGADDGPGTRDRPFATLARALAVSDNGDTIEILSLPPTTDEPSAADGPALTVPSGVTIEGATVNVRIMAPLTLLGNVTFNRGRIARRLVVVQPRSQVSLSDMIAERGISVEATATGSSLAIQGESSETRSDDATDSPVSVLAPGATVSISVQAHVQATGVLESGGAGLAALRLEDPTHSQQLTMLDTTVMNATGATTSLALSGASTVVIERSDVSGRVDLTFPTSNATLVNDKFRANGGVLFQGATLTVAGCDFIGVPLEQDSADSHATIHNTVFEGYSTYAYHLRDGHIDLGNIDEPGLNTFRHDPNAVVSPSLTPTALVLSAPATGINGATVSATTFDGMPFAACMVTGNDSTKMSNGVYIIEDPGFVIDFY